MDPDSFTTESPPLTSTPLDLGTERLNCANPDTMTERWEDPNKPAFMTVLLRFFGNIFVDCFRAIFE
ncbi:uncharacterized protein LOC6580766 [Drosophila mojavensis]|uniref:Uncharacterized protein n=1 Tax=Drosophila mojavensis TaxID=7230 RepID=B4KS68_DROMO|nr:uncharacterized protein LOC6580766 [Drosophila mojavensis]EDW10504.1 uncharacterized protein Dmoj_GI18508 [Drosophila mojavensis]